VLTITNSTIANNRQISSAGGDNNGAGIFAIGAAAVTIVNSTIANNTQVHLGGGTSSGSAIFSGASTPFTLVNTTIAGNSGGKSLSGSSAAAFKLTNTIVSNAAGGNCNAAFTSGGHNLETADECSLHSSGDKVNTNPLLGPLIDNGGPTNTMALLAGSPAIDAGDAAACRHAAPRATAEPVSDSAVILRFALVRSRA